MPRFTLIALFTLAVAPVRAADPPPGGYLPFIRDQAANLRAGHRPPATLDQWQKQREVLRNDLLAAWGGFPAEACPLDPKNHGELKRDGYRVEKVTFQTRPGVRMTANVYAPDKPGRLPAILMVHGHWKGAKQDPVVQSRCIGAAKLGFFVLCVDAFGAGERGVGTALGEYHGDMTGATLLPVGLPLSGLQVYENVRAVDYLLTRPEVDKDRIGITGASGGGNQTMYAGAWDERFKAVVPVCSVGNYQAYLGPACCMCEVVPGALKFTEEGAVLGLVAPRALLVVSATRDGPQFSVDAARESLAFAGPVFDLYRKPGSVRHAIFESGHDYSKVMREEMYGWMTLHLKGEGDGSPVREPEFKTENPEDLRCFPGDTRPKDFVTIPKFAAAEAKELLAAKKAPAGADEWAKRSESLRTTLIQKSLGGFPNFDELGSRASVNGAELTFEVEPGVTLTAGIGGYAPGKPLVVLLTCDGAKATVGSELAKQVRNADMSLVTVDLRATGKLAVDRDRVGRSPDHNSAEWALWVGRPLVGQWTADVRRLLDYLPRLSGGLPKDVVVVGEGPAGLVALCAAATDKRVTKAAAVGTLASYVTEEPYTGQRLGLMAPGILRDVGDVAHVAALAAPKRIVIAGGVGGDGKPLTGEQLKTAYQPATHVWELLKSRKELVIEEKTDPAAVVAALK